MFWKNKEKELSKKIDLNINEHNAAWLINEELKRMHDCFHYAVHGKGGSNGNASNAGLFWAKIQELQVKMVEYVAKAPDHDMQKSILDIQEELVEKIVLGGDK